MTSDSGGRNTPPRGQDPGASLWEDPESTDQSERLERLVTLGTLALGIVHEVAGPISSVEMTARYALETDDDQRRRELLLSLVRDVERCRAVLQSLSAFMAEGSLDKRPADVTLLVRRAAERIEGEGGGLALSVAVEPEAVRVPCHAAGLEQVLCDLLRNAVQAGGGRAHVLLQARRTGRGTEIVCEDDGPGVPEADRERIFTPFFTTTKMRGGTGLGLALARRIVHAHGGTLWAEKPDGRGARFVIALPDEA